jgi:hypothetical protein
MHGERRYGLPDLPQTAYVQEYDGRWGVWVEAVPFCISLALSCDSKEVAIAIAKEEWRKVVTRHPEYAGQDPIIANISTSWDRSARAAGQGE